MSSNEIHLQALSTPRTARIGTWGQPDTAQFVWIACHGYGQLLPYFLRPFTHLNHEKHFVIAPEGLSRFYLEGTSGRVGASWMTKEERLQEIEDQFHYLDRVKNRTIHLVGKRPIRWVVFGFSQGVATINRWLAHHHWSPDHIVNWAGSPPADVNYAQPHLQQSKWWYVFGNKDPYISRDKVAQWTAGMAEKHCHVSTLPFQGGHTIPAAVLQALANALNKV